MKFSLTVRGGNGQTYIPKIIRNNGFEGRMEVLADKHSLIILHPKATSEELRRSIRLLIQELENGEHELK